MDQSPQEEFDAARDRLATTLARLIVQAHRKARCPDGSVGECVSKEGDLPKLEEKTRHIA